MLCLFLKCWAPQAATTYYYQIYDQDAGAWSSNYELKTVPSVGSPLTFAVFGDLGDTQVRRVNRWTCFYFRQFNGEEEDMFDWICQLLSTVSILIVHYLSYAFTCASIPLHLLLQAHHNGNSTIEWLGKVQNDIDLIWHSGDVG